MHDLSWLIHPFDKSEFFASVWQRKPHILTKGSNRRFQHLFGAAALENVIEFSQPKPPSLRLACNSKDAPKIDVPFAENGRIDIERIRKHYLSGYTVILNSVQDYDPTVAQMARALHRELYGRVQVNCYCTPPTSQGFAPHYDTHDVLVAQVEGEKLWKVYDADSACPLNEMCDGDPKLRSSVRTPDTFTLREGDVLYIPRGWIHEAEAMGVASLHLTFGLHPPLNKDLLTTAVEQLTLAHPKLREALPIGPLSAPDSLKLAKQRLGEILELLNAHANAETIALEMDEKIMRLSRSAGDGHLFKDIDAIRAISPETRLERRNNIAARMVAHEGGLGLQMLGSVITAPSHFEPAMQYVLQSDDPFAVQDLPDLTEDESLALGASLVTDGLCRVVDTLH